ncbi:MAG: GNAT family N-acetyltransferase [Nocardioides sp.]
MTTSSETIASKTTLVAAIMQIVEFRPAAQQDGPRLVELFTQWGHPLSGDEIVAVLTEWDRTSRAEVILAEVDGDVAGLAAVMARPYLARPGWCAHLIGLVVAAQYRRDGLGSALVAAAEDRARAWGCDRVELTSSRSRVAAHAFYPTLGYQEQSSRHARYLRRL